MNIKNQNILAIVLVVACVLLRIVSNGSFVSNFTPVLAVGLFAGSVFTNKKLAIALPLIIMFIGDLYFQYLYTTKHSAIAGFYGVSQLFNYIAFAFVAYFGTFLKSKTAINIFGFAITGSLIFFIVSNFGVWADTTFSLYPKTLSGLTSCFINAIPFYKNSLISDVLFSTILFSAYLLYQTKAKNIFATN